MEGQRQLRVGETPGMVDNLLKLYHLRGRLSTLNINDMIMEEEAVRRDEDGVVGNRQAVEAWGSHDWGRSLRFRLA